MMNQLKLEEVAHGKIMISLIKTPFPKAEIILPKGEDTSVVASALKNKYDFSWDE